MNNRELEKDFRDLSESEKEIMELLWQTEKVLCFAEILTYFVENKGKTWKKQNLSVFLLRMTEKGMIQGTKKGRTVLYTPTMTEKEYEKVKAKAVLHRMYEGSISHFMTALYGGDDLNDEDLAELKEWLDDKL